MTHNCASYLGLLYFLHAEAAKVQCQSDLLRHHKQHGKVTFVQCSANLCQSNLDSCRGAQVEALFC